MQEVPTMISFTGCQVVTARTFSQSALAQLKMEINIRLEFEKEIITSLKYYGDKNKIDQQSFGTISACESALFTARSERLFSSPVLETCS